MGAHGALGTEYARAVAEPIRLRLIAALDTGPRSVASLARELGIAETRVVREARKLEALGLIRRGATDGQSSYELMRSHTLDDAEWEHLPVPIKRSVAAATVVQMHALATAAVDAGGFDGRDAHLTRTAVPAGAWTQVARTLRDAFDRVVADGEQAKEQGSDAARAYGTALIMLFASEHEEIASDAPIPEFNDEEAGQRTYGIVEAVAGEMVKRARSWDRIASLAEELRIVARAAAALEDANRAPLERAGDP